MRSIVTGIGELLWDIFADGRRLGGAPLNFACQVGQLGGEAYPVTAVGQDEPGSAACRALETLGVDGTYVGKDADHPTGTAQVSLDEAGKPAFRIPEGVAWDFLEVSGPHHRLAQKTDAVCFGSLAQRSQVSRGAIHTFLASLRPDALRIFDVNLRQAFYSKVVIETSLRQSNVLKLSDEELPVLMRMFDLAGPVDEQLRALLGRFDLRLIAFTRGGRGSLLMSPDETNDHSGRTVEVVDTVGAGDAYTAALCMGLLGGEPLAAINDHANRVAAYVCTQQGATPELPGELIWGAQR